MESAVVRSCAFDTGRLRVGPWRDVARDFDLDLETIVASILNDATTVALPEPWRGDYSVDRARVWIAERERESPTQLVVEQESERPVALMILFETGTVMSRVDLRLGYIVAETDWGRGFASELVGGLVGWARAQPSIQAITGGVAVGNAASAHVLIKNGFAKFGGERNEESHEEIYRLHFDREKESPE